jgi:hypothetical protein
MSALMPRRIMRSQKTIYVHAIPNEALGSNPLPKNATGCRATPCFYEPLHVKYERWHVIKRDSSAFAPSQCATTRTRPDGRAAFDTTFKLCYPAYLSHESHPRSKRSAIGSVNEQEPKPIAKFSRASLICAADSS